MSILQFLRIIWARRFLVLGATIACVVGAFIVILIVPPRWDAHSRVMLNTIKPDPVTGQVIAGPATRAYVATQVELVKDYSVAGAVAEQLGWLSDPNLIQQYRSQNASRSVDFRRWLAQRVIDRTKADVVEGSNILEITYSGPAPAEAKTVADALRRAYIDASVAFRRDDASRNAQFYGDAAAKAKAVLDTAQDAELKFERDNGIVMQDDKDDIETARLKALAAQGGTGAAGPTIAPSSPASMQLAQVDAQIAEGSKTLGPNHPELLQLKAQRASLAAVVGKDEAAARSVAAAAASAGTGAIERAVEAQKSRVMAQRDKLDQLQHLQAQVDLAHDQYTKTAQKAADLNLEATIQDIGLTPLSNATTPQSPTFPNKPLILFGSLGLGLAMGVLASLLAELIARRVRGAEDLQSLVDLPLLGVLGTHLSSGPKSKKPTSKKKPTFAVPRQQTLVGS